jgi:hypothetical protein
VVHVLHGRLEQSYQCDLEKSRGHEFCLKGKRNDFISVNNWSDKIIMFFGTTARLHHFTSCSSVILLNVFIILHQNQLCSIVVHVLHERLVVRFGTIIHSCHHLTSCCSVKLLILDNITSKSVRGEFIILSTMKKN